MRSRSDKVHSDAANMIQNLCMINKEFRSGAENRGNLSWNTDNSALRQENRKVISPYFLHCNSVTLKSIQYPLRSTRSQRAKKKAEIAFFIQVKSQR